MRASERFALVLLLVMGTTGTAMTASAAMEDSYRLAANQTLTGRPDYDSHPGPGDTDINNDGKKDLDQINQGAKTLGQDIDQKARDLGYRTEVQLDRLGDKAGKDLDQLGREVKQLDLNDADSLLGPRWQTWVLLGLLAVAVVAMLYAASHRRRRRFVNRY